MIGLKKPLFKKRLFFALACGLVSSAMVVSGQQPPPAAPFTADQANAGRAAYQTNCASCHGADLMGYPPLAGPAFIGSWSTRNTRDLFGLIQTTMPSDRPGSLPADTYVNIVAFILQSNGRPPGNQPLTATTSAVIGGAAGGGQAPVAAAAQNAGGAPAGRGAGAQGGAAGGGGRGRGEAAPLTGLTVTGEVKDYTRVTDEMLRNPAPGDWLTIRRDHFASNYSPLTQITRDNASELQLAWVAPMAEGGTNQPSPLAHNGTINDLSAEERGKLQ